MDTAKQIKELRASTGMSRKEFSEHIKLDHTGNFYEMRVYDKDPYLTFELA